MPKRLFPCPQRTAPVEELGHFGLVLGRRHCLESTKHHRVQQATLTYKQQVVCCQSCIQAACHLHRGFDNPKGAKAWLGACHALGRPQ